MRIAERCNVDLSFKENYLPNFDVPAGFTLDDYFEHIVRAGLRACGCRGCSELAGGGRAAAHDRRVRAAARVRDRHDQEDEVPGYFLIVWDFIRYAREQGIPVGPGRGSAAGSFVAYCLRITDVDPLEYDLIFERFLNPERVSLPDIDIDFCERRRGEVIEYVTRKYGRENVAQIITFGTMKARAVVRDVGRVMDMPYADVDRVAKAIPPALDMTLEKALDESPALKEMEQKDERVKELLAVAQRLEGMTRHAVGPRRRRRHRAAAAHRVRAALQEPEGRNRHAVGDEGGRARRPPEDGLPRPQHADADRRRARRRSSAPRASTSTSTPSRSTTRRPTSCSATARPTACSSSRARACASCCARPSRERLDDLIALNALYRPGPLKSGMVDDFIARKQGKTEVKYELPQLEPILVDTYGVIAYQEQVMRIAAVLAGFTMGQSDVLRKAMGKKDPKVMAKQREAFMAGARRPTASTRRRRRRSST